MTPRAYLITPVGSNAVIGSYAWNQGDLLFDPSVPLEDAKGRFPLPILSFYHSYDFFGRSANIAVSLPYAIGRFDGNVAGSQHHVYRSGMVDMRIRAAFNIRGGRAMKVPEFVKWKEKTLVGVSITTVIPTGQVDPARVINTGTNRWAFRPDIGFSRRRGRWVGEVSGGVWFFSTNRHFYPGDAVRSQQPMGAIESHLAYYAKPRLWASFDVNFWGGGRSSVNGVSKDDRQTASRVGGTVSIPLSRHHSVKFSANRGAYVAIGGNYTTITGAWQYSWIGKRL
jgi:hypothetical protein